MAENKHVFISYSSKDFLIVELFSNFFKEVEIATWIDTERIVVGDEWRIKIERALKDAACMIVLVSPDSVVSGWVREEIALAQKLDKKIFPVLLRGDEMPFGLNQLQFLDLRRPEYFDRIDNFATQIQAFIKPSDAIAQSDPPVLQTPILTPITLPSGRPLTSGTMILLQYTLQEAAELLTTDKNEGRASLLWFDGQTIFVAGAIDSYANSELLLTLSNGKGIAGEFRAKNIHEVVSRRPAALTDDYMIQEWQFTSANIAALREMNIIVMSPVLNAGRIVGILCIDNTERISDSRLKKAGIFEDARRLANIIGKYVLETPFPYFKYRSLKSIVQTACQISPYHVVKQAAIYWADHAKQQLLMICAAEEYSTEWSTVDIPYDKGVGLTGAVWERGVLTDDREHKSLEQVANEWKLTPAQKSLEEHIKSMVGVPILAPNGYVLGVLVVASPEPMRHSHLDNHRVLLNELAKLVAETLLADG